LNQIYKGSNLSNNGHQYCKIPIQEGKNDIKINKTIFKEQRCSLRRAGTSSRVYRDVIRNIPGYSNL
jgi:hypothetical protein